MGGYSSDGASAGVMPADSINDLEIDWGTGADQVSLDDVPDGSTYARVLATSLTVNEVTTVTDAGGFDLTVALSGANRVLTMSGAATLNQSVATTSNPTFAGVVTSAGHTLTANDVGALGASGTAFSDLFLASGGVINFNAGNYTVTHTAGDLSFSGSISF